MNEIINMCMLDDRAHVTPRENERTNERGRDASVTLFLESFATRRRRFFRCSSTFFLPSLSLFFHSPPPLSLSFIFIFLPDLMEPCKAVQLSRSRSSFRFSLSRGIARPLRWRNRVSGIDYIEPRMKN